MKIFVKLLTVLSLTSFLAIACSQAANSPSATANNKNAAPPPGTSATASPASDVAGGKELYTQNCKICHKETGEGGKVTVDGKNLDVASLTSDKMKKRSDEKLASGISEGAPDDGMPAFKAKLKPEQITEVVKYVRTLQGQ
ncbi:MAG: cytochrome c [Acidobacteria bacterium]|nr:cytochrome c [Acidobacteriota bacterium]